MTGSPSLRQVDVTGLPDPSSHSYAHGVQAGGLLAIAGQCGVLDGGIVPPNFADQSRRVLERLQIVVEAAGGTIHDIMSMTVFLTDIRNGPEFTRIRKEFFGENFPVSALIGVDSLMPPGAHVEAQAWAFIQTAAKGG